MCFTLKILSCSNQPKKYNPVTKFSQSNWNFLLDWEVSQFVFVLHLHSQIKDFQYVKVLNITSMVCMVAGLVLYSVQKRVKYNTCRLIYNIYLRSIYFTGLTLIEIEKAVYTIQVTNLSKRKIKWFQIIPHWVFWDPALKGISVASV